MTQPQYYIDPNTGHPTPYPQQPAPPAAPPVPQYPPAPSVPQGYGQAPAQYGYAQPGYPPQVYPGQPAPNGWGVPAQPVMPPQPPPATGTLDDFYGQPTVGLGKGLKFQDRAFGTRYVARVSGPCTVRQLTDFKTGAPRTWNDGNPRWQLLIPVQIQPDAEHPDGNAVFYVKGRDKDELNRAMAAAGEPESVRVPPVGSILDITYVEDKPNAGASPTKIRRIVYTPSNGAAQPAPVAPQQAYAPPAAPVQPGQPYGQPAYAPQPTAPAYQPPPAAPQPQQPAQYAPPAPPQQPAQYPGVPQPAANSEEAQRVLAQLLNQQVQQPAG